MICSFQTSCTIAAGYSTLRIRFFFALRTAHADGHQFIADAYKKGIRNFVVSEKMKLEDASFILVDDTLKALQQLVAWHRRKFQIPTIGITGSNGKTIVKEWLNSLLEEDFQIVRSPRSYNSQIGVPLSVWQMDEQHSLAIFEAGISSVGEMQNLADIIQPTIGVLTNIGEAHSEGFSSKEEKLNEKLQLFPKAEVVIGPAKLLTDLSEKKFTWGRNSDASLQIENLHHSKAGTRIEAVYREEKIALQIPFSDEASIQNAITCWCVMIYLGKTQAVIQDRFNSLQSIDMRLQLNHGINHCLVINDSYSADTTSLELL
jgi:alanine racemase